MISIDIPVAGGDNWRVSSCCSKRRCTTWFLHSQLPKLKWIQINRHNNVSHNCQTINQLMPIQLFFFRQSNLFLNKREYALSGFVYVSRIWKTMDVNKSWCASLHLFQVRKRRRWMENDALRGSSYEELTVFFNASSSSFGSVTHKSAALLRDRSSFSISPKHADNKQHTTTR